MRRPWGNALSCYVSRLVRVTPSTHIQPFPSTAKLRACAHATRRARSNAQPNSLHPGGHSRERHNNDHAATP